MIWLKLFRAFRRRKKKHKRKKSLRELPIVRREYLSDDTYLQTLLNTTKGGKKMQFPYEIPPVEIALTPETTKTLYYVTGGIAIGMIGSAIIKKSK